MPTEAAPQEKPTKLPTAAEHARSVMDQVIAARETTEDPKTRTAAEAVPTFSKGTAALDPETGKPILPKDAGPEIATEKVALAEPTETTGGTEKQVEPTPAETTPQAKGEKAAEETAKAVQDRFAEYEEFELDEPDYPEFKVPVRVPKQYAQIMKRAFPRRADYDRMRQRLGDAEPVLGPLIADGRIKQVLPLIEQALANQAYGEYVWEGFRRLQEGKPLVQAPVQPQVQPVQPGVEGFVDPLVQAAVEPLQAQIRALEARYGTFEERQASDQRAATEKARQQQVFDQTLRATHNDLAQRYPGEYRSGLPGDPAFARAIQVAKESGYIDAYGLRAGIIFGADAVRMRDAEAAAATASPAAQQIAEREQALAREEAARSARTVAGGAPTQPAPPKPKGPPKTTRADGTLKTPAEFMSEMLAGA